MSLIGWILSPQLWAVRTVCSIALILLIWSDTMTAEEMILSLPAEFFPIAFALCALIGFAITGIRSYGSWKAQDKTVARDTGDILAYGMNFLTENIAVVIGCALIGPILTGCYYHAAGVDPNIWGVIGISATVAAILGWGGDKLLKTFLEGRRDGAKADEARAAKAETKTQ